jgi:hypothetical protein
MIAVLIRIVQMMVLTAMAVWLLLFIGGFLGVLV